MLGAVLIIRKPGETDCPLSIINISKEKFDSDLLGFQFPPPGKLHS